MMRAVSTRSSFSTVLMLAGFSTMLLAAPSAAVAQAEHDVTFTKDVAPILQRSCERCHRPHGGAPMSLISYQDVRPWARSIKQRTLAREMPPWFVDKNIGIQHFKDDPSLSDDEIALIGHWVDAGAPRGNPADMPRRASGRPASGPSASPTWWSSRRWRSWKQWRPTGSAA